MLLTYQLRVDIKTRLMYRGKLVYMDNTLEAFQRYVNFDCDGGHIRTTCLPGGIILIIHSYGKLFDFPVNRALVSDEGHIIDVLVGNIVAVRAKGEEFSDILPEDVEFIEEHLKPAYVYNGTVGFLNIVPLPEYPS